ncbi:MAG: hypothetical protein WCQ47_02040, partial [bacterium]
MAHPFKAYDVRGIYGKDVTEELAYKIGRAFVDYLKPKTVVVGMDMRESSKPLLENLIKGLREAGADVINVGLISTDMLYFASVYLGTDGAIQITASHNPKEYNGLKFIISIVPIKLLSFTFIFSINFFINNGSFFNFSIFSHPNEFIVI